MATGAAEEWERTHTNGWMAVVSIDADGVYHYLARDTAETQEIVSSWHDKSPDLATAQRAADQLVPSHVCDCPNWVDVTAKVLLQVKCAADHDIAATYTRRELQERLSAGTLMFYCSRCGTERPATAEEHKNVLRRLHDRTA